jgi:hypothetical protein
MTPSEFIETYVIPGEVLLPWQKEMVDHPGSRRPLLLVPSRSEQKINRMAAMEVWYELFWSQDK